VTPRAQHSPQPWRIVAERCTGRDLRPGDLFSTCGPDYWAERPEVWPNNGAVGEKVYIYTGQQGPDPDTTVYRIRIERAIVADPARDLAALLEAARAALPHLARRAHDYLLAEHDPATPLHDGDPAVANATLRAALARFPEVTP